MNFALTRLARVAMGIVSSAGLSIAAGVPAFAQVPLGSRTSGQQREAVHQAQVEARVILAPRAFKGSDAERHLAYELRITSFQPGEDPIKLIGLRIFAGNSALPLRTVEGAGVATLLSQSPQANASGDGVPIASGRSETLFLWLTLPGGTQPAFLRHELIFRTRSGTIQRADDVRVPVISAAPIRISAPLRAGRWLTAEGPGNHLLHHWGGLVAIDATLSIPQRFAVDWFGLDKGDHAFRGSHASPASTIDEDWIGYGQGVLAVADGVVADARDGIPDGKPLAPQQTPDDLTNRTLYGNFVVLRIAPGVYAHYAHLKSGSLKVGIGQRVRRGTMIGQLGQTGAAGAPHLHFHISDRPTFERSEGLPFVIDSFTLLDRGKKIEDMLDPARPSVSPPFPASARHAELPLDGDVVTFPPQ